MTTKELTKLYREIIMEQGYVVEPERNDTAKSAPTWDGCRQHLLWMLDEMDKLNLLEPDLQGKWHAWRGFVQGALWIGEIRTIDEMRDDSRGLVYDVTI